MLGRAASEVVENQAGLRDSPVQLKALLEVSARTPIERLFCSTSLLGLREGRLTIEGVVGRHPGPTSEPIKSSHATARRTKIIPTD